ncbi:C4-dicarboxylate ABC transporter, partial [Streptomyces sp. NPDC005921]
MVTAVRYLGPNWYASVMGTAALALGGGGPRGLFVGVWALSLLQLVVLLVARALHWIHHRDQALAHLRDPAVAPFYGCLSMALLAVGGGALALGRDWIGEPAAVVLDAVLFVAGTAVGLTAAVAVPYPDHQDHRVRPAHRQVDLAHR